MKETLIIIGFAVTGIMIAASWLYLWFTLAPIALRSF